VFQCETQANFPHRHDSGATIPRHRYPRRERTAEN